MFDQVSESEYKYRINPIKCPQGVTFCEKGVGVLFKA